MNGTAKRKRVEDLKRQEEKIFTLKVSLTFPQTGLLAACVKETRECGIFSRIVVDDDVVAVAAAARNARKRQFQVRQPQ